MAHPFLKDASASVSIACAQASDGQVQLGSQDSVFKYMKTVKQSEAPDRKDRMVVYPDVVKLIQIAWEFGPNDNLDMDLLKRKLVIISVDGRHGRHAERNLASVPDLSGQIQPDRVSGRVGRTDSVLLAEGGRPLLKCTNATNT